MRTRLICCLALLLCPLLAFAQPLADRVPADATLYVGWQGIDNMGAGYPQSNLKGLLESSDFRQFISQAGPGLTRMAQQDPEAARAIQMVSGVFEAMWRHPTAFYFTRVDFDAPMPTPQLALICRAGTDADNLLRQFQALVAEMKKGEPPFPVEAFRVDDVVGIQIGHQQAAAALAAPGKSITTSDRFRQAMARGHKDPLTIAYLDARSLTAQIDRGVQMMGGPEAKHMWSVVRDVLGLPGLNLAIATSGFEQKDWTTQLFVSAPAPRQGLLGLIEPVPVKDELLRAVPVTATWVGVTHFDVDRLLTQLRTIAPKIDPDTPAIMDQTLAQAREMTGVDLQRDLFAALGEHWAYYSDPQSTGRSLLSMVVVNRARKPAELEKSLTRLATLANDMIRQQMRGEDARIRIAQAKVGGMNLTYVPLPFIAPAWGMKDGVLYVGLYPQMVAAAANAPAGRSILENPDFIAMRKRLSPAASNHILFMNLPQTAADAYPTLLMVSQIFTGLADMAGVDVPPMVMPPLPQVRQFLAPAGNALWVDDQGLHGKAISPFPGAELLASQGSGAFMVAPMVAGVMLPAVQQARASAQRVQSASNLKQIAVGALMYQNDFRKNPADLGVIAASANLNPQAFISAVSGKRVPPDVAADPKKWAAWVNANADYVYLGAALKPGAGADAILAFEKPELHGGQGMNVVFADGHVEWLRVDEAMRRIERQQGR